MRKTSQTHPLQIAIVPAGAGLGSIGLTLCPGKRDRQWDRDLGVDLDAIRAWGAAAVITLITKEEFTFLQVEALGQEVARRQMAWFNLPIVDVSIPDTVFEQQWGFAATELHSLLRQGRNVLIHCRGGLGRAGIIAARLLVELGRQPRDAISQVRGARPGAIQTGEQKRYVMKIGAKTSP